MLVQGSTRVVTSSLIGAESCFRFQVVSWDNYQSLDWCQHATAQRPLGFVAGVEKTIEYAPVVRGLRIGSGSLPTTEKRKAKSNSSVWVAVSSSVTRCQ